MNDLQPRTVDSFPTASAIRELTDLAAQARGVDLVTLEAPDTLQGVPENVPVGIRHGSTPEIVDVSRYFEAYRTHPARKKGTAEALTLASFIALAKRHQLASSAIFADTDWRNPSFTAVIDYHELHDKGEAEDLADAFLPGTPAFGQHRIRYLFPLSDEWKIWTEVNGESMSQLDFAVFLEDRIAELSAPTDAEKIALEHDFATTVATPSQLIQLSRGLQVNVDSRVKNVQTLQSGEAQIAFEESHTDADGKPLKVPGIFILSIAPFFMGGLIRIPVRLRYRVRNGNLAWSLQMYRPDQHVTDRVRSDLRRAAEETGLPAFEAKPEMAGA
jgi:uncharacterized protein YfdQ (DUF2303 family)